MPAEHRALMGPTFAYALEGQLGITVHGVLPPGDDEWLAYLEYSRSVLDKITASLVFTDGGGPNGQQRALLAQNYPEFGPIPLALVSAAPVMRGIVTALRWFGKEIQAFKPTQLADAFDYLKVPEERRLAALHCAARLRAELARQGGKVLLLRDDDIAAHMDMIINQRLARVVSRSSFPGRRNK